MHDNVSYEDGTLRIFQRGTTHEVEPACIVQVYECRMADPVHHGDETFHLLRLRDDFWLLGPMVDGALGAVDGLLKARPGITLTQAAIGRVPWKMRQPGTFGLRLWPIAGLGRFSNAELQRLHIREVSDG